MFGKAFSAFGQKSSSEILDKSPYFGQAFFVHVLDSKKRVSMTQKLVFVRVPRTPKNRRKRKGVQLIQRPIFALPIGNRMRLVISRDIIFRQNFVNFGRRIKQNFSKNGRNFQKNRLFEGQGLYTLLNYSKHAFKTTTLEKIDTNLTEKQPKALQKPAPWNYFGK